MSPTALGALYLYLGYAGVVAITAVKAIMDDGRYFNSALDFVLCVATAAAVGLSWPVTALKMFYEGIRWA